MKIRTKILVTILSMILVIGTAIITASYTVSKNMITRQIHRHLETTAQSRTQHIETFIDKEKGLVMQLSASEVIKKLLSSNETNVDYNDRLNTVIRRLKNTAVINTEIHDIMVLDTKGRVVASNIEEKLGLDRSDDPYFINGKEKIYIKDVYFSRFGERKVSLAVSAPIAGNETARLAGILVIRFGMDYLYKITRDRTGLGKTGEVYLINRNSYIITPSRFADDPILKQKVDTQESREWLRTSGEENRAENQELHIYEDYRGNMVLGTHYKIAGTNWCLLAEIDEKEALAPVVRMIRIMFWIMAALLAAGVIITLIVSEALAKPIVRLHHGTEEVEKGNLDYRVGTDAKDEIGQLSRSFDTMTAGLKESRGKLEDYSANLEKMVAERTAELEEANEEVKQFAYIVSHDLRAPLVNLRGFTSELRSSLRVIQSAMDDALPHLDEDQKKAVDTALDEDVPEAMGFIESSVTRMDRFINAVLKLSRIGRREFKLESIDMNALVDAILETLTHQIEERSVKVTVEKLPGVTADRTAMEQIIGNLLNNAISYLDPGRPGEITVTGRRDGSVTTYSVRDNGRGIAKEDEQKVFAPFRRAGRNDVKGEGMGLSYVQTMVRRHGGRIWFESEAGAGTTFNFTIQ